jgi:hypothetical protein
MFRWFLLTLASVVCLAGQIRWKCDAKDGKFIVTPCANCQKFYCWDGKIFSEEAGYTPPPAYVLQYWEEVHRRSQQIREDIERRGKELREQVQKGAEESKRLNQERMQAHQEYMDDLHRRINERRSAAGAPHSSAIASSPRAIPKDVVVVDSAPAVTAPSIPPVSRAKAKEVQVGMGRAAVEGLLGKPHSAMSIPEDDGFVEILTYTLDDQGSARVRMERGKVVSVQLSN